MNLIPNWKKAWRMFSIQAQGLALALVGAWQASPEDLRGQVPSWVMVSLLALILVGGIVGRLISQPAVAK
jgi:hypothetical protein